MRSFTHNKLDKRTQLGLMSSMVVTPLFSTSTSLKEGGIFTLEKAGDRERTKRKHGPISLCDLAKDEKMDQITLVESNFVNFMNAAKNLGDAKVQFRFGLRVVMCEDMTDKSEASLKTQSKLILFMRNSEAYKPLIKLFTKASTEGFYYVPRLDWKALKEMWSDDIILTLPFYSSFLAKNTLTFASIAPDLPAKPLLLKEIAQDLPFDSILEEAVNRYVAANGCEIESVKSIYYKNRDDAKKWLIWRCILDRGSTWDKPNQDHCTSKEFCYEAWKELSHG